MRLLLTAWLVSLVALIGGAEPSDASASDELPAGDDYRPWPAAVLDAVGQLPVQNEGRVKPLASVAGYTLLGFNGSRSLRIGDHRVDPTAWFLDVILRPEIADGVPVFRIEDASVLEALGLEARADRKRFDRWSYRELEPLLPTLADRFDEIRAKAEDQRSAADAQVLALVRNLDRYENLQYGFRFLDVSIDPEEEALLGVLLGDEPAAFSTLIEKDELLLYAFQNIQEFTPSPAQQRLAKREIARARQAIWGWTERGRQSWPMWLPPIHGENADEDERWWTTIDAIAWKLGHAGDERFTDYREALAHWEALDAAKDEPEAMVTAAEALRDHLHAMADHRSVSAVISEYRYQQADLVFRSLLVFVLAFLILCGLWLRPQSRILAAGVWLVGGLAQLMLITAITWRCLLRGRPPVTTLYETVLFITASVVLCALVMELINRRRIALSIAMVLGAGGLFMARSYEATDAADTMPQLQAVLDTNFWLSTHVTTVTLGYAAGLLAGALGHLRIAAPLIGLWRDDRGMYRALDRMIYGVTAFGLLFATVGTILGGIWANDSWGRFWGWDPKENGALMIVLAQLAMLHARMAGWISGRGFAIAAVATAVVVGFSWWQVNLLGVGLHSYGHTSGVQTALYTFYAVESVVMVVGLIDALRQRFRPAPAAAESTPASAQEPPQREADADADAEGEEHERPPDPAG